MHNIIASSSNSCIKITCIIYVKPLEQCLAHKKGPITVNFY